MWPKLMPPVRAFSWSTLPVAVSRVTIFASPAQPTASLLPSGEIVRYRGQKTGLIRRRTVNDFQSTSATSPLATRSDKRFIASGAKPRCRTAQIQQECFPRV